MPRILKKRGYTPNYYLRKNGPAKWVPGIGLMFKIRKGRRTSLTKDVAKKRSLLGPMMREFLDSDKTDSLYNSRNPKIRKDHNGKATDTQPTDSHGEQSS